jgi:hypothetical protein
MIRRLFVLSLATGLGAALLSATASPARLHEALPPDSTERNGEPQPLVQHAPRRPPPAALPGGGMHPDAKIGIARVYSGTPIDVTGFHYDGLRTGWNRSETDLNPTNVKSSSFGQIATLNVDGIVLAQPLIVSALAMPDGKLHNVLVIVTEHNTIYGYDAQNYTLLWQNNLGPSQSTVDVGCGDVRPEYGISSTPVVVRPAPNSATMYLVAATEAAPYSFHTKLHAIDLRTGRNTLVAGEIAPKAKMSDGIMMRFDPQNQWSRAGLVFANNSIYVAIASHCDNNANNISGWMLRYDPKFNLLGAFHTIDAAVGYELSTIWMSGFAPSVDGNGNLYSVTGNGNFGILQRQKGWGQSVLALSADLTKVVGFFTPASYQALNNDDDDFGSGGIMLLPTVSGQKAPPMAVAMGKSSILYLLNQKALGGLEGVGSGPLQQQSVPGGGVWGGPAYYNGPNGALVYYQSSWDLLRSFKVNSATSPSLSSNAVGTSYAGFGGSMPIVSSNGSASGTGVVWLVRRGTTVQLEAYDALKLGNPIFQANAGNWNTSWGNALVTPMEANGRVYVPAYKTVTVFGLTN